MKNRSARLAFATLAAATALAFAISTVDARPGRGGSTGNRGARTEQAIPQTPTAAPRVQQPAAGQPQRPAQPQAASATAARPSMARTMMTGFAAGLLGAGLFGLLSGQGFFSGLGGLMGLLGLLLQAAIIFLVIRLAWNFFTRRKDSAPVPAGVPRRMLDEMPAAPAAMPAAAAAATTAPQRVDAVGIGPDDYGQFHGALVGLMGAYGTEDVATIRMGVTPEMAAHFENELAENARRGVVNRLGKPELLSGDLAESWFEGETAYATVALRYRMTDVTLNRTTGQIVAGDANRADEIVEHWTFRRERAGQYWLLSAIAQA
jgi:predicted lipid-binding transport protein (Tim44 family)